MMSVKEDILNSADTLLLLDNATIVIFYFDKINLLVPEANP